MAISNAVNLANLSSGDALTVDSQNDRVGIATTTPTEALTVVGVVSATSFFGDGSNLEGVASAGLGTALGDGTNGLEVIYFTDKVLTINDTITVDPPASTNVAYTQYSEVAVADTKDLIIADGDDFIPDILGLSTEGSALLGGAGGRVRADNFTNRAGNGAPNFPSGITGTTGIFSSDVSIADKIVHTGDTNTAIRFPAADTFTVETAGSERLRINSAGEVQIANGNLKFSTSGTGIDFSATADGTGTASSELLDDYEEGEFTPTAFLGTTAQTVTTATGTYTKIGNTVFFSCRLDAITKSGTGQLAVGGLPYTPLSSGNANLYNQPTVRFNGINPSGVLVPLFAPSGSQFIFFQGISASGSLISITDSVVGSTYNIYGLSGFYTV